MVWKGLKQNCGSYEFHKKLCEVRKSIRDNSLIIEETKGKDT